MLGVIVTAHTTLGGTKMIFRYPPVIRDQVSSATLRDFALASGGKAAASRQGEAADESAGAPCCAS